MKLSEHFTLSELTNSATAYEHKILNEPTQEHLQNLKELCQMLEGVRIAYQLPIRISSGYRSKALNEVVPGASPTSSHCYGLAADIKPVSGNSMRLLQKAVIKWAKKAKFDQVIFEKIGKDGVAQWLHIGLRHGRTGAQRQQLLYTFDGKKYYTATEKSACMTV